MYPPLDDFHTKFIPGQFDDRVPRYAEQAVVGFGRGGDTAIGNHEQVFATALGNGSIPVQQHSLVVSRRDRLSLRQDAGRVKTGYLHASWHDRVFRPAPGRCLAPDRTVIVDVLSKWENNQRELVR